MAPERRRLVVLVGILAAVSLVALYEYWPSALPMSVGLPGQRTDAGGPAAPAPQAPDVRLRELTADRPAPEEASRNLFRYRSRSAPASDKPMVRGDGPIDMRPPDVPSGPPSVPPIALRFIGLVEAPEHDKRIAILSDGRGIYRGQEGDIIEGRYRILRINPESVEMAYLDGRGRQIIRLSGS